MTLTFSPPFSLLWRLCYPPLPTQIASKSSSPDWESLALVLTRSCLVSLLSPRLCGLNTEDWLKVEAEVPVICVLTRAEEISQWNKNGSYKGKRKEETKRDAGRGSRVQNIPHNPFGLQPRGASFIPLTHSTEGGNEWGKDVIPVDSAQMFSFLVTQRPGLSHPSLLLTSTHQIAIRDDRSQCMHV